MVPLALIGELCIPVLRLQGLAGLQKPASGLSYLRAENPQSSFVMYTSDPTCTNSFSFFPVLRSVKPGSPHRVPKPILTVMVGAVLERRQQAVAIRDD